MALGVASGQYLIGLGMVRDICSSEALLACALLLVGLALIYWSIGRPVRLNLPAGQYVGAILLGMCVTIPITLLMQWLAINAVMGRA